MPPDNDTTERTDSLTAQEMRTSDGLHAVLGALRANCVAVRAMFMNGTYKVECLSPEEYIKLRRGSLVSAYPSTFRFDREAIDYMRVVGPLVADRKVLVFVGEDEGCRVYHFHI